MNQELMERLQFIYDSGQIGHDVYETVPTIVRKVEQKFNVELTEENGGAFITHLAIALQRIKDKKVIQNVPENVWVYTKKYPELHSFAKEIIFLFTNNETVNIDSEAAFITLYFCLLTKKEVN